MVLLPVLLVALLVVGTPDGRTWFGKDQPSTTTVISVGNTDDHSGVYPVDYDGDNDGTPPPQPRRRYLRHLRHIVGQKEPHPAGFELPAYFGAVIEARLSPPTFPVAAPEYEPGARSRSPGLRYVVSAQTAAPPLADP